MARSVTARRQVPATEQRAADDIDLGWLGSTVGFYLRTAQEAAFHAYAQRAGNALDDLSRRGLVIRERVEDNRRSYSLTLTPQGRRAMRELMKIAAEHEREVDRLVGRDNRAEFIRTLQRIAAGLAPDG
jgi:hypothetical protein